CDVAALRAELALAAPPQVPHDLLRALDLLRLLLVEGRERALHGLARREVAAAQPEDRDAVRELLLENEAALVEVGSIGRAVLVDRDQCDAAAGGIDLRAVPDLQIRRQRHEVGRAG